jgi:hypothetical protein
MLLPRSLKNCVTLVLFDLLALGALVVTFFELAATGAGVVGALAGVEVGAVLGLVLGAALEFETVPAGASELGAVTGAVVPRTFVAAVPS